MTLESPELSELYKMLIEKLPLTVTLNFKDKQPLPIHLKREYPQLEAVLDQPPCERCCELWSCHNSEECLKLTAWLIAVTGGN